MVMLYLLGIGDVYCSHQFETVYWTSFISALFTTFPALRELPGTRKFVLFCAASHDLDFNANAGTHLGTVLQRR
jgi:hypothetical protein